MSRYWSDPNDSSSLEESVELLSEDSSTVGSGLYASFGSSAAANVIMPDLDESGKKAPLRMRCRSKSNCRRGSAKRSLLYISCDFLPVLWCPRICLTSALRPALPAQLSAVLSRQWMVVVSGSCPRAQWETTAKTKWKMGNCKGLQTLPKVCTKESISGLLRYG